MKSRDCVWIQLLMNPEIDWTILLLEFLLRYRKRETKGVDCDTPGLPRQWAKNWSHKFMRVVRVYRVNRERPPLSLSLSLLSSYPVLRDPLRVSYARVCMSCRLGFGRHGALMNGGCRLHARETPEKIFKFVFTSPPIPPLPSGQPARPVQPLLHPPFGLLIASWLPRSRACDIRLRGKWTRKYTPRK